MMRLPSALIAAALLVLSIPAIASAGGNAAPAPEITLGQSHSCVLADSGKVLCWGANDRGQLGTGDTTPRDLPTEVVGLSQVKDIAAYRSGTCAVNEGGRVFCWGGNTMKELGSDVAYADPHPTPAEVPSVEGVYRLVAGSAHICAVSWNKGVSCWGDNTDGQLAVSGQKSVKTITAAGNATCLRTHDQTFASCSGAIAQIPQIKDVFEIAAGAAHGCLVSWAVDGVTCWGVGMPDVSKIGSVELLGASADQSCAVARIKLEDAKQVRVATSQTDSPGLQCWGAGQELTAVPLADVGALSVSSTATKHCAIVRGGDVHCWEQGALAPVKVEGLDLVTRPQYPANKWIEIRSKLKGKGENWKLSSRLHLQPSPFVFPAAACDGSVTGEVFYWKKVRKKSAKGKKGSLAKNDGYEQVRVGVRTKSKLRRVGDYCKADFTHTVSKKRFGKHRRKLLVRALGSGNKSIAPFESGESAIKDYKPKKK